MRHGTIDLCMALRIMPQFAQNKRTAQRRKFNQKYLDDMGGEISFVYGLVNFETGEIGYIGVSNDPTQRHRQHLYDAKRDLEGTLDHQCKAKCDWINAQPDPPGLKIFSASPSRDHAELIEKCLIKSLNLVGNAHNWKFRPQHCYLEQGAEEHDDDIPY